MPFSRRRSAVGTRRPTPGHARARPPRTCEWSAKGRVCAEIDKKRTRIGASRRTVKRGAVQLPHSPIFSPRLLRQSFWVPYPYPPPSPPCSPGRLRLGPPPSLCHYGLKARQLRQPINTKNSHFGSRLKRAHEGAPGSWLRRPLQGRARGHPCSLQCHHHHEGQGEAPEGREARVEDDRDGDEAEPHGGADLVSASVDLQ